MIALIQSGFLGDFSATAAFIWAILFALGALTIVLIRQRSIRFITAGVSLSLLGICDLMVYLPTPAWLSGDGYAITQNMGLIGASYLAPWAAGVTLALLLILICK